MPTNQQATYYGYDFESSYEDARRKALDMAGNPPYDASARYSEDDFKESFRSVFNDYLDERKIFSLDEALVNEHALDFILVPLLARHFRSNAVVTRTDLASLIKIIERLKEIIRTILNP